MKNDTLAHAIKTLRIQIDAILALIDSLNHSFTDVIRAVINLQGHLIITGVGKSGHIGHKISATLASTGTPSFFVHPTEAGHGDLGMITKKDIVLAISYSGETEELNHILHYTKHQSIPLIAMTSNASSTLAGYASFLLELPKVSEAGNIMRLAPTTSTLITLALGDALAICLAEERSFSNQDFSVFHPAGSLSRKALIASSIMHKENLPLIKKDTTIFHMLRKNIFCPYECVGVLEEDHLIGIVTHDILQKKLKKPQDIHHTIESVMTPAVMVTADTPAQKLALMMNEKKIRTVFVITSNKKPIGIIHISDLLMAKLL